MSCTICGSTVPCACSQSGVGRTCVDPCGVQAGCAPNDCCGPSLPASPVPFYACVPACPESHTQTLVQQQFYFDISAQNSWNIPTCGNTAVLAVPGLKSVNVGSYIWNATYGYFEITAFDVTTGQLTILNHCNEGNAAPGTTVPACTLFTVTVPPAPDTPTTDTCLALDFTAPPVCPDAACCINITLTNLGAIAVGDAVQIGGGRYTVDAIVSTDVITICNDLGLGLVPGTPVIALDSAGNYQYCLIVVQSCCSLIQEEFPDGLTPCSDFENKVVTTDPTGIAVPGVLLTQGQAVDSNPVTLIIPNESDCRDMEALVVVTMSVRTGYNSDPTGIQTFDFRIRESINGSLPADVYTTQDFGFGMLLFGGEGVMARQFSYITRTTITPGATTTIVYTGRVENNCSDPGPSVSIAGFFLKAVTLGVAV